MRFCPTTSNVCPQKSGFRLSRYSRWASENAWSLRVRPLCRLREASAPGSTSSMSDRVDLG